MPPAVARVDPRDDAAWDGWYRIVEASEEHARPGEPHWSSRELRASALRHAVPADAAAGLPRRDVLLRCGEGAARLELHLRDNTHLADLELHVHPGARRRGLGTALLQEAVRLAREDGRTHLGVEVDEPSPDVPGAAFARAHGFACQLRETRRDLVLPVAAERLEALEAQARPYAEGYELRTWRDRTPDELLADRAVIEVRMSTDAPSGDLPWEREDWDGDRVRGNEELNAAQGRTWFAAGALREGRLVAHTEVGVPREVPERAYQWGTLVLAEHRGHRLGMLVKLAALRALQAASPRTRVVSTWNAETNRPMVAVNEALGFVRAGALSSWSRRL